VHLNLFDAGPKHDGASRCSSCGGPVGPPEDRTVCKKLLMTKAQFENFTMQKQEEQLFEDSDSQEEHLFEDSEGEKKKKSSWEDHPTVDNCGPNGQERKLIPVSVEAASKDSTGFSCLSSVSTSRSGPSGEK